MKVTIEELCRAATAVFSYLESTNQLEFDIEEDFYWDIPVEHRYDRYDEPATYSVGQLSEDWEHVRGIADGTEEPTGYALVWLAMILRRVGEVSVG